MDNLTTTIADYITANPGTSATDAFLAVIAAAVAAGAGEDPAITGVNDALYFYVNQ